MLLKASAVKTLTLNFFAKVSAILLLYSRYKPCKFKNKVFAQIPFRRVVERLRPIFIVFVQKNSAALAFDSQTTSWEGRADRIFGLQDGGSAALTGVPQPGVEGCRLVPPAGDGGLVGQVGQESGGRDVIFQIAGDAKPVEERVQRPVDALRRSHYGNTAFLHLTARSPMPDSGGALVSSAALVIWKVCPSLTRLM
nr:MAG TPA: hypothetical protein [Caudoviricetes sp.]